jgi:hypothetical protein
MSAPWKKKRLDIRLLAMAGLYAISAPITTPKSRWEREIGKRLRDGAI